jgi:hypothetical protein
MNEWMNEIPFPVSSSQCLASVLHTVPFLSPFKFRLQLSSKAQLESHFLANPPSDTCLFLILLTLLRLFLPQLWIFAAYHRTFSLKNILQPNEDKDTCIWQCEDIKKKSSSWWQIPELTLRDSDQQAWGGSLECIVDILPRQFWYTAMFGSH